MTMPATGTVPIAGGNATGQFKGAVGQESRSAG
jgi:hypothetical protein